MTIIQTTNPTLKSPQEKLRTYLQMPTSIPCPACHIQFSIKARSTDKTVRCPKCGNRFTAAGSEAIATGDPSRAKTTEANEQKALASGDHWAWMLVGVLAILTNLICGYLGVQYVSDNSLWPWQRFRHGHMFWQFLLGQGLCLVLLLILPTSAAFRTLLFAFRRANEPSMAGPLFIVGKLLSSFGKAAFIGVALVSGFVIPFAIVFGAALLLGEHDFNVNGNRRPTSPWVDPCALIGGLVTTVVLAIKMFRRFFAKNG